MTTPPTRARPALAAGGALLLGLVVPAPAATRTLGLNPSPTATQCASVDLSAESMTCDRAACELRGEVELACGGLRLWADALDIALDEQSGFAGAEARGRVLVVEQDTVLTCERFRLGADRIQGTISSATFRVKVDPRLKDARGVPAGRDRLVVRGDLERTASDRLRVDDADLTLCDCGAAPPSWRLSASRIDLTVRDRAWLYWPQLWLNPFGLGLVPVSPPLPPISVALRDRAAGLLAPELKFIAPPWPILDLPVFIPLGDSWDVTVKPGLRLDWGAHRVTPLSTWGAPRLGGRLRWAPSPTVSGELQTQWTFDRKGFAARALRLAEAEKPIGERLPAAYLDARDQLTHRVDVAFNQRVDLGPTLRWLTAVEWVSDDLITQDFRVSLEDQVANYLPSRSSLTWRGPGVVAELQADYLLVLNNALRSTTTAGPGGPVTTPSWDFSNLAGREAGVTQRGPWLRLRTLPLALAKGVYGEAEASLVRYGPWTAARPPDAVIGGGRIGLTYRDAWRGLRLAAGTTLDLLWIDPTTPGAQLSGLLQLDATASTQLGRRYGALLHVIEPALGWRNIPWLNAGPEVALSLDPRLERRTVHQAVARLGQGLWRTHDAARIASLNLAQPIALRDRTLLPTRVDGDALLFGRLRLGGWVDVDLERELACEEVGATLSSGWGPLSGSAGYSRWTPRAERFRRATYELAAAGARLDDSAALHLVRGNLGLRVGTRVEAHYETTFLLPIADPPPLREEGFSYHRLLLVYRSPCDCWEVSALVHLPAQDPLGGLRAEIKLAIGGYALGT